MYTANGSMSDWSILEFRCNVLLFTGFREVYTPATPTNLVKQNTIILVLILKSNA